MVRMELVVQLVSLGCRKGYNALETRSQNQYDDFAGISSCEHGLRDGQDWQSGFPGVL